MSPNEIPGKGLGYLPDKRKKGVCRSCERDYRTVKVRLNGKTKELLCPHCGKPIKPSSK